MYHCVSSSVKVALEHSLLTAVNCLLTIDMHMHSAPALKEIPIQSFIYIQRSIAARQSKQTSQSICLRCLVLLRIQIEKMSDDKFHLALHLLLCFVLHWCCQPVILCSWKKKKRKAGMKNKQKKDPKWVKSPIRTTKRLLTELSVTTASAADLPNRLCRFGRVCHAQSGK